MQAGTTYQRCRIHSVLGKLAGNSWLRALISYTDPLCSYIHTVSDNMSLYKFMS